MHLSSLVLKGFKSFAETVTLVFEPGVTVIVGPNGSGKSNIVDALAWVLGAQGPRALRSERMDDVIFAGTPTKPALGRAEVTVVLDNADRRVPLDLAEVSITRTLFRNGDSEYAMNGASCRLLDIQELLSDSGLGRSQHVIVSQGNLEAVLHARPEDRRAVIEEAAGILKYRRRRERAERRLASTAVDLERVQDLLREVRRQMRPLQRQVASAARFEALGRERDHLRRYRAGRELEDLQRHRQRANEALETATRNERALEDREADLATRRARLWPGDDDRDAGVEATRALATEAARVAERAQGVRRLAEIRRREREDERARLVADDRLARLSAEEDATLVELAEVEEAAASLGPRLAEVEAAEAAVREAAATLAGLEQSGPGRRPEGGGHGARLARLKAEVAGAEAVCRRAAAELERVERERRSRLEGLEARRHRWDEVVGELAELAAEEASCRADHEAARAVERQAAEEAARKREELQAALARWNRAQGQLEARAAALDALRARAGAGRLAGAEGVLGALVDHVEVETGFEQAFLAAADAALDGVLVVDAEAEGIVARLAEGDDRGAVLPVPEDGPSREISLPPDALRRRIRADGPVSAVLDRLLAGVVVVDDLAGALRRVRADPDARVVTRRGDRFGPTGWFVGVGRATADGVTAASLGEAEAEVADARRQVDAAQAAEAAAEEAEAAAAAVVGAAERHLGDLRGRLADRERIRILEAERLDADSQAIARLATEEEARREALADASGRLELLLAELAEAEAAAAAEQAELDAWTAARRSWDDAVAEARRRQREAEAEAAARRREVEVAGAALEAQVTMLRARRRRLGEEVAAARRQAAAAAARLGRLEEELAVLRALEGPLAEASEELEAWAARLTEQLARDEEARRRREEARRQLDAEATELAAEREATRRRREEARLALTEAELRLEAAVQALRRELRCEPDEAMATRLPEGQDPGGVGSRLEAIERELSTLGMVNPLAATDLAELEERAAFLETQLADVRTTERELRQLIAEVDREMSSVFQAAWAEVTAAFGVLVAALFPGGEGWLRLTDPETPLGAGVEIEVRPAGKQVRRMSLLSGGERSLVALAFLAAVFRSRPSPFLVLDEVEAALDDVSMGRFLRLVEELRAEAQLILVSHQRRTMEIADRLFGVSMRPGGGSVVVSERLGPATSTRRTEEAPVA